MTLSSVVYTWIAASGGWFILMWFVVRSPTRHAAMRPWLLMLVVLAVAVSAAFTDVMSDDALRYRWDGHVVSQGVNPYDAAPADPSMQQLAVTDSVNGIRYPDAVTYPHIRTIYPPGAQLLAGAVTWIAGVEVLAWKLTWFSIIVILLTVAIRQLWHDTLKSTLLLAVLLCPTVVLHGFVDVHFDMPMALFVLLAMIALERRAVVAAGLLFGLAISIKYVVVLLLPLLLLSLSWRGRLRYILAVLTSIVAVSLPFVSTSMFDAFRSFATTWQSNAFLYSSLVQIVPEPGIRYLLAGIGMVMGMVVLLRLRRQPLVAGTMLVLTLLLVSPVVHPWYLLTPLLIAPIAPLRTSIVWGAMVSLYGLAYMTYKGDGVWLEDTVTLAVQFVPVLIAWTLDVRRSGISASAPTA